MLMPFYDPPINFFHEAIASVAAQTYLDWELILVNDGSGTDAMSVARQAVEGDPNRIKLVEHPQGARNGISASRTLGLQNCCGEFVAFLDADDVWDSDQLSQQVYQLGANSRAAMVYGNTIYWYSWQSPSADDRVYELGLQAGQLYDPPEILSSILRRHAISPCMTSILVRYSVFEDGVKFVDSFKVHYEDQVFLAQVFCNYPVFVAADTWGRYRQHENSTTGDGDDSERARRWRRRYLEWLEQYLADTGRAETDVARSLRTELWMFRNPVAERIVEWLRLWRRRLRRILGR